MVNESTGLQFIKLLVEAWECSDRQEALLEALREMKRAGGPTSYNANYAKFSRFVDEIEAHMAADPEVLKSHFPDLIDQLLAAIVTDTWKGSPAHRDAILQLCQDHPILRRELERIRAQLEPQLVHPGVNTPTVRLREPCPSRST